VIYLKMYFMKDETYASTSPSRLLFLRRPGTPRFLRGEGTAV
jgi:hypothetical protein